MGSAPPSPECTIKGNISEKGYGKLYFLEGYPNYLKVKVDTRKGERVRGTLARGYLLFLKKIVIT